MTADCVASTTARASPQRAKTPPAPPDDGLPLGLRDWLLIVVVAALGIALTQFGDLDRNVWRSTEADAPLVVRNDSFLPPAAFEELASCAAEHPRLGKNPLLDTFSRTEGLLVRFTAAGVEDLENSEFGCLARYVEHVRDENANGFVLNVVSAGPGGEDPVQWHLDQSFPLKWSIGHYLAHRVSVLYVRVPSDIVGGHLELRKLPEAFLDEYGIRARFAFGAREHPDLLVASVPPAENTLVTFRGDAHHRVRAFNATGKRVSLVLEQYRLPAWAVRWRARRFYVPGEAETPRWRRVLWELLLSVGKL